MSIPILVVIPFWEGDKALAIEICRIIAGLQQNHSGNQCHVMLSCRQDCQMDQNMVNIVAQKFNVLTYQCRSPLRGWPAGPNGMFGCTMTNIALLFKDKYECVYWLEPDAVPIRPNWFWDLVLEWRRKHPAAKVVGCRHDCNGNGTGDHITGCALYDPNIARIIPELTTCDNMAWDYQHRAKIVAMAGSTTLIQNWYKSTNAHSGVIEQPGVVIIHGFKDMSVVNHVKSKYNIA